WSLHLFRNARSHASQSCSSARVTIFATPCGSEMVFACCIGKRIPDRRIFPHLKAESLHKARVREYEPQSWVRGSPTLPESGEYHLRFMTRAVCLFFRRYAFHFENPAADVEIALGKGDLDSRFAEFLFDGKIEIAAITAWAGAHLTTPDHEPEIDRVVAEFIEKNTRGRIL